MADHDIVSTVVVLWESYTQAAQSRRDAQNQVLHALRVRWMSGSPRSDAPSWMTALLDRLDRLSREEGAAHDEWLRQYCRARRDAVNAV